MRRVWLIAGIFWIVASALACWLYPVQIPDACSRYAPMADAFARGDFYLAFHPGYGLLFSCLAGSFAWIANVPGIYAVQLASFLLLALAGVAAFAFARRLTSSEQVAWWTFALVLLMPDFFINALDGLRESAHCLTFSLLGLGIVARNGRAFGLGLFLYIITFSYGFFVASVLLGLWCIWVGRERGLRVCIMPTLGWLVGTALVTVLVHAYTGHWVPVRHAIGILGRWL